MAWMIGDWEIVPDTSTLQRGSDIRHITPRAMQVLIYLAEHSAETISVETLRDEFWSNSQISDAAVYKIITELRHALDENSKQPKYLKTVPKQGYRLIATVGNQTSAQESPVVASTGRLLTTSSALAFAVVILLVLMGRAWLPFSWDSPSQEAPLPECDPRSDFCGPSPPTSVAILRFETSGANHEDAAYVEALTDSLIEGLGAIERVHTTSRSESFLVSSSLKSMSEIAEALQVEHLLEGSVHRAGDRLQVSVRLARVEDGVNLYSQQFDNVVADDPKIQEEIAERIVLALEIHLDHNTREQMFVNGTSNAEAYSRFIESINMGGHDHVAGILLAQEQLGDVIRLDPNFSEAYVAMASSIGSLAPLVPASSFSDLNTRMTSLIHKAKQHNVGEEAMRMVGLVSAGMNGDLTELERIIRGRLQKTPPSDELEKRTISFYYDNYGGLLLQAGLFSLGDAYKNLAVAICKRDGWSHCKDMDPPGDSWNTVLWRDGPAAVIPYFKEMLQAEPSNTSTLTGLAGWLAKLKRFDEAERYLQQVELVDEGGLYAHHVRHRNAAYRGDLELGSVEFEEFLNSPLASGLSKGYICLQLGDVEKGIGYLRTMSFAERSLLRRNLRTEEYHFPKTVRNDSRYQDLLNELNMGNQWKDYLAKMVGELEPVTGISLGTTAREIATTEMVQAGD